MEVHWKIGFLGGIHEKLIYRGKRGVACTVCRFKGELHEKEGVVFLRGGWYPNAHYEFPDHVYDLVGSLFFAIILVRKRVSQE